MREVLLSAVLAAAAVIVLILTGAGIYMVYYAIVRKAAPSNVAPQSIVAPDDASVISRNKNAIQKQADRWLSAARLEKRVIRSHDGLPLVGNIYWNGAGEHRWLLGLHGYAGKKESCFGRASFFGVRGYHVLLPDLRAHGESGGRYIGMGWLDRLDVLQWVEVITAADPEAEIVLHGVSMGAAALMMAAGEPLPENVKCVIEDCGFTSVWDIFKDEMASLFKLPAFPILNAASLVAKLCAGYSFTEASAVKQLAKAATPVLFIHGDKDNFVRTDMVYQVYDACPTPKDILVVEGAGHCEAYAMDPQLYFDRVFRFIDENCSTGQADI